MIQIDLPGGVIGRKRSVGWLFDAISGGERRSSE
jgi:hypothetical protein